MKYLTEETIKQIFFYCDVHEPNALIADEVDICQFADKLLVYVSGLKQLDKRRGSKNAKG